MKKLYFIIFIILIAILYFYYNSFENSESITSYMKKYNSIETGTVVLNYHEVEKDKFFDFTKKQNSNIYNVPLSRFEEEINYIIANDIPVISMDELNNNLKSGNFTEKNFVITFDDIDKTVYENAYPILKENNIPFTSFIVTSQVGKTLDERTFASWDEIKEMQSSGLQTVGLHTDNLHFMKNGEPIFLDKKNTNTFEQDLEKSIAIFQKNLGYEPKYFAYPYGFGIPETDNILLNHNIELIFSLKEGIVTTDTESFYIPRILITKENDEYIAYWFKQKH